jgi:type IV secretion system protein VirD4
MDRGVAHDTDAVLLAIGTGSLAVALGVWTGGLLVSWAWSGTRPRQPASGALGVLIRTLASPSRPDRAWPSRSALAPPPVLVGAELLGAVLGLALVVIGLGAASHRFNGSAAAPTRRRGPRTSGWRSRTRTAPTRWSRRRVARLRRKLLRPPPERGGGWARPGDLAALRVHGPVPGRLTLGRLGGSRRSRLLAAEHRASLIVLGPSQSGKTTGLAIPAILEWPGPVVATSVKADLVRDTLAARSERGPAWVYDPTGSTGVTAAGWTPLGGCDTWLGARRTAAWLSGSSRSGGAGLSDEEFWYTAASKLLGPYLLAARLDGRDMEDVVRWIDTQEEAEVSGVLDRAGETAALAAAVASWQRDDRTRSSVFTTAEMILEAYADPNVLRSAVTSDIQPARLLAGGAPTLYICAPGHEQERLRPVFATLLQTVLTGAYDAALARGGSIDPPLLIVLDEAANIAPLKDLDAIASTAAGHGIQLVTVWQDLAQLRARYGERASTVVNNHRAKLVLSGISDPATLEYASRLIGEADVQDQSLTIDPTGARSTTRAQRERRLAPDAELRRIRPGEGVLVYGHLPPVRIRLRPWFEQTSRRHQPAPRGER